MNKYLLISVFSFTVLVSKAQSLSFGIEFMQRNNKLTGTQSWMSDPDYNNAHFHVKDSYGDTLGVVFNRYKVSNNFELPLYMRYKFKKRWTVDLNFSTSKYNITLDGTSNYNDGFFSRYFLSEDEFNQQYSTTAAQDNGQDFQNYDASNRKKEESEVQYIEKFKLTTIGTNISYSLYPHKTIHPFIFSGLSYRAKSKQYSYDEIDIRSRWLNDKQYLSEGVVKYAKSSYQFKLGAGIETYRFRAGLSWDYNFNGEYSTIKSDGNKNVYRDHGTTPYDNLRTFSFYLSADILSKNLNAKKQLVENSDIVGIDKLELKKNRHQFGMRIQKVGASKVNDYDYSQKPLTFISAKYAVQAEDFIGDSVSFRTNIQSLSFKGISLVDFTPKVEGFYRLTFLKKFEYETSIGWQHLTVDMKTRESDESYVSYFYEYSNGDYSYYAYADKSSRVFSGAYRNDYNILNFDQTLVYNFIENDFLKIKAFTGFSFNYLGKQLLRKNTDRNTNSLTISKYVDEIYVMNGLISAKEDEIYVTTDDINVDFKNLYTGYYTASTGYDDFQVENDYMTKLDESEYYSNWKSKYSPSSFFPVFRLGLEAEIDRFSFGANFEKSFGGGDGLIIKDFSRLNFSIGYILFRK